MPLVDHFRAPLYPKYACESFHTIWAACVVEFLTSHLPRRFYAMAHVHLGSRVEADVAEFEQGIGTLVSGNGEQGGLAVATWSPAKVTATIEAVFPDDIEVQVYDSRDGATLVAVIELVSPGNKDRHDARGAFAAKCAAYLQRGLGVIVVDVVTERHFNLHNALMQMMNQPGGRMPDETFIYATAYRPARRDEKNLIDVWWQSLTPGEELPSLPLALRGVGCIELKLETTYMRARQMSGI